MKNYNIKWVNKFYVLIPAIIASYTFSFIVYIIFKFLIYFHFLFKRQRQRSFHTLVHSQKCPQQTRQGQAKARSLEFYLGLSPGLQDLKYLSHYLLHFRMCINRKLDQKQNNENWNQTL